MNKITIAVIGCGTIANSAHIPAYMANEDAEIKYFCDIVKDRADDAVAKYECGQAIEDYNQILNDPEVDAVSICTPNDVHASIAIDCLRAGKHVLCENRQPAPTQKHWKCRRFSTKRAKRSISEWSTVTMKA